LVVYAVDQKLSKEQNFMVNPYVSKAATSQNTVDILKPVVKWRLSESNSRKHVGMVTLLDNILTESPSTLLYPSVSTRHFTSV
jgi:hypothetical protein